MNENTVNQEADQLTFGICQAEHRAKFHWHDNTFTLEKLTAQLLSHKTRPVKDSYAFVPARLLNGRRKNESVVSISLIVFDIDGGQPYDEVIRFVRDRGFYAFVYTTYSHLSRVTSIRCDHFEQWASRNNRSQQPDEKAIEAYLADEKRVDYLTGLEIKTISSIDDDGHPAILVEHDPIHKLRVVFPLKQPFVMKAHGGLAVWKRTYLAIGEALGLRIDSSCSDAARLYYWPSHPPGTPEEHYKAGVVEGAFLDFRDFKVEKDATGSADPKRGAKSKTKSSTADVRSDLVKFAKDCGRTFKIATALQKRTPSKILSERDSGGFFIECPYEAGHTAPSPQRTYLVDGDGEKGFVIYCSGEHCQKSDQCRDRLDFLGKMLDDGWLDQSDLEDPALGANPEAESRTTFVWEKRPPLEQAKECCRVLLDSNQKDPKREVCT